jgi:glycine cleavage system H protein
MKEIDALNLPDNLRYSNDHEWARRQSDLVVVGINDYAQDQLGDIVFVELPETGTEFDQGQEFGTVESVKAVSELYMPIAGQIVEVNTELEDSPETVNSAPYDGGWMLKVKASDPAQYDSLMDRQAYLDMLKRQ